MFELSRYAFIAAMVAVGGGLAFHAVASLKWRSFSLLSLATGGTFSTETSPGFQAAMARFGTTLTVNAFLFLTASLGLRWVEAGHGPFSNMYEFSLAFAWGSLLIHLYFEFRYRLRALAFFTLPVALGLLIYATTVPDEITPLVPALQNNLLLTIHVAVAILAYGAFTVGFGAAVLYLIQHRFNVDWLPRKAILDEIGYKAVMAGFPLLALVIILGAVWAEIAWGTY
ncbi:MAG: cytochrome c biogenesis protein CcsA, partial [Dehalococcoidia bacterium]